MVRTLILALASMAALAALAASPPQGKIADKPLFRDPVQDGAADPTPIWNKAENKWFIFYTNRRALAPVSQTPGVTWVHGTKIGIAQSSDGGATWTYRGIADIPYFDANTTEWAPEVIENDGIYHMYLAIVPGIFADWNHPRSIVHLTSADLLHWKYESTLKLASDRVIDPCVMRLADGTWRMWYNDERTGKSIYYADSPDLNTWKDGGKAVADQPGEGPVVFRWHDQYWMLVDVWKGLAVYHSDDAMHWVGQKVRLLEKPGHGPDDNAKGGHPGIEVTGGNDGRVFLFYFVHPGRGPADHPTSRPTAHDQRRSSLQVVELNYDNGLLTCNRDEPTRILMVPPGGRQ